MNYILVTPAKNEERNLPILAKSVVQQTITPMLWVIVDDGSTDNTPKIIKKLERNFDWIHHKTLEKGRRDLGKHFAEVLKEGFEYAIDECNKNGWEYDYLGKVDADIILPTKIFEKLIKKFKEYHKLGIASSGIDIIMPNYRKSYENITKEEIIEYDNALLDHPTDAIRLIRKKCFEEIKGIPITYAPDSVIDAKARILGWKTKRFKDIKVFHIGKTSSAEGLWKGTKFNGYENYYLNTSPILVIVQATRFLLKRPYYLAFAYLYGYFSSVLRREEKIDDENIRNYFRYEYPKEVKRELKNILKGKRNVNE